MSERRDTTRLPLRLEVEHILGEGASARCLASDISTTGVRISRLPGEDWGQPRHAWLQFQLPDEDAVVIRALGELCHESPDAPVRGFRFKYIYPRARRRLERFLDSVATA